MILLKKWSYYNEIDPAAAQWIRNLIKAGLVAPGEVDERSIEDVLPSDVKNFVQCHWFAGIAVWSHALRNAGVPDSRSLWTGSCPCQPFSAAGAGAGFVDERHLWPAFFHLIQECRPALVLGEQVASKDANPWIDLVQADMEALGYGVGAVAFPSAGVGAPHIRDRLYWVADAQHDGRDRQAGSAPVADSNESRQRLFDGDSAAGGLANAGSERVRAERLGSLGAAPQGMLREDGQRQRVRADAGAGSAACAGGLEHPRLHDDASQIQAADCGQPQAERPANIAGGSGVSFCGLGDSNSKPAWGDAGSAHAAQAEHGANGGNGDRLGDAGCAFPARPGPVNGFWRAADWLSCRDGKWRPVEPGTFPLADGPAKGVGRVRADWHAPAGPEGFGHRITRLKAYGNAINAKAAQVFIESVMGVTA